MRPESDDSPEDIREGVDKRLVGALTVSFLLVALIVATAVYLHRADDGCSRWEQQLHELSGSLTRHRLAKGTGRIAAIEDLESLRLPCKKVGEARDLCAAAYRHLDLAEREQQRAKTAVDRIEKAVASLGEPHKTIAIRRVLQNASIDDIAEELALSEEDTQRALGEALAKLGPNRLSELHEGFEKALEASKRHVKEGTTRNDDCDAAFKRLLEEAQIR